LGQVDSYLDSLGSIRRLVILPDGKLNYLPFELLQTAPTTERKAYASIPFLLKKYAISYAQAVPAIFPSIRRQQQDTYLGFAPSYDVQGGRSFTNLTFNAGEIQQAADFWDGTAFLQAKASKSQFEAQAPTAGILHLAMHAMLNDSSPQYSYLQFTDAPLYTYELYSQPLAAQLAVLSACNTGIGKLIEGEGVISLARAFQYAGCPSVAMSLWPVDDQTTAHLMLDFFQQLQAGLPKDEALRAAKLAYLDQAEPALAHPFYWAGINLIGDRSPMAKSTGGLGWMWALLAVNLLLVFVVGFWRLRN